MRQVDGSVTIDGQALSASHHGHILTSSQLRAFDDEHPAATGVTNGETACHGVSLLFDDGAEADRYVAGFTARAGGRGAPPRGPAAGRPASRPVRRLASAAAHPGVTFRRGWTAGATSTAPTRPAGCR